MLITKSIEIDAGHRVPQHKSKCRNLHGHRYKIAVGVDDTLIASKGASDEGMVIDYGDLKTIMMEHIDAPFDHAFIMWKDDIFAEYFTGMKEAHNQKIVFMDSIPTAENLAIYWYYVLKKALDEINIKIKFVRVWETPNSTALYQE